MECSERDEEAEDDVAIMVSSDSGVRSLLVTTGPWIFEKWRATHCETFSAQT